MSQATECQCKPSGWGRNRNFVQREFLEQGVDSRDRKFDLTIGEIDARFKAASESALSSLSNCLLSVRSRGHVVSLVWTDQETNRTLLQSRARQTHNFKEAEQNGERIYEGFQAVAGAKAVFNNHFAEGR